jgi:hypothetical protein
MVPSTKAYVIVLATVIPTVTIISIIGIILLKRRSSKNTLTTNKHEKPTENYQLDQFGDECSF